MMKPSDFDVASVETVIDTDEMLLLSPTDRNRIRRISMANLGTALPLRTGPSAYQVAVGNGFVGTEADWLLSLEGPEGPTGPTGPTAIHIGTTAPVDTSLIWVDTTV